MAFRNVLIVDDSRLARVSLTRMLEKRGFQVDGVESGEEALEYIRIKKPDLIFMDYMMPAMSGFEATSAIASDPDTAHIPVVMCTSQSEAADRDQATLHGARAFITKPATERDLDAVMQHLLDAQEVQAAAPALEHLIAEAETRILPQVLEQSSAVAERIARDVFSELAGELEALRERFSGGSEPLVEALQAKLLARLKPEIDAAVQAHAQVPAGAGDGASLTSVVRSELAGREADLRAQMEWSASELVQREVKGMMQELVPRVVEEMSGRIKNEVEKALERARPALTQALFADTRFKDAVAAQLAARENALVEHILADPRVQSLTTAADSGTPGREIGDEFFKDSRLLGVIRAQVRERMSAEPQGGLRTVPTQDLSDLESGIAGAKGVARAALGAAVVALAAVLASLFVW